MRTPPRRTIILAISSASVAVLGMATFETAAVAIRDEFGVPTQLLTIASAVPAAASMIPVFVAGLLSTRVGWFTLLRWSAGLSGTALVVAALAPSLALLTMGRAIGAMGVSVLMVAGLGILQQGFQDEGSRARVFGLLAAAPPVIYLTAPSIVGLLTDRVSWRAAILMLALVVVALGAMTFRLPPVAQVEPRLQGKPLGPSTWATPLLAGMALATLIGALIVIPVSSLMACALALSCLAITIAAILLWRRSQNPGLDLSVLRRPGASWVTAAMALTSIVNFAYFAALWLQSQPGADTTSTALALTVPQLAGVAGGVAGGRLAARYGPYPVAIVACLVGGAGGFIFLALDASSSALMVIVAVTVPLTATLAASGPITQAFLANVVPGTEGAAGAWRTAIRTVATACGGILVISVAAIIYRGSIETSLREQDVPASIAFEAATDLQGRVAFDIITSRYQLPDAIVNDLSSDNPVLRQQARADAMGTAGIFTVATNALAAGALIVAARRQRIRTTPRGRRDDNDAVTPRDEPDVSG